MLKGLAGFYLIYLLYYQDVYSIIDWLPSFFEELLFNVQMFIAGYWQDVTILFRIVLITLLIWLMSYLLHYWFVTMKRVFFFFVLTIIYVSIFHTFQPYDAGLSVIRLVIVGIIALSLANMIKTIEREAIPLPSRKNISGVYTAISTVIIITFIVGYFSPVKGPQWEDPVPQMRKTAEKITGQDFSKEEVRKVGYGEDDSELGGTFQQDDSTQFLVLAPQGQYWRIESKDVYTGKGWDVSSEDKHEWQDGQEVGFLEKERDVDYVENEATFLYSEDTEIERLIYPYWLTRLKTESTISVNPDYANETAKLRKNKDFDKRIRYTTVYESPSYSIDDLKEVTLEDVTDNSQGDKYTQLPQELPKRVYDLAEEITDPYDNLYEQVVAIEQYFGGNGFRYETVDIPVPNEDEDYVDQFLFDTKKGYCDNYSTSMVVLLRTLGIEARWVKGFTEGKQVDEEDIDGDIYNVYEVASNNAHSWVEVYFPGSGWIPFEPTQGFSNLADFHQDPERRENNRLPELPQDKKEELEEDQDNQKTKEDRADKDESKQESEIENSVENNLVKWLVILVGVLVVAGSIVLYMQRDRLLIRHWSRQLDTKPNEETYERSFAYLLTLLRRNNLGKTDDETLREYARRVDEAYEMSAMREWVSIYERYLYSNESIELSQAELKKLWETIVNRIQA